MVYPTSFPFGSTWDKRQPNFFVANQPPAKDPDNFNSGCDVGAGQVGQTVGPNAGAGPYFGANLPSAMGPPYGPSSLGFVGAAKLPTSSHRARPYGRPVPTDQNLGQPTRQNANLVGLDTTGTISWCPDSGATHYVC
ncbi:hypothetical protein E1A91_A01G137200v1 [Gossypium mustelinum]|uniref:Uncharacterized protein n=1 Tax=Gossypium mustelinum TaxID=34275 RepID=A0A5D3AFG2_GOSMU|nr:hypothetical protein E1A91_A01G137200v1 [Gossypium mustelinum]